MQPIATTVERGPARAVVHARRERGDASPALSLVVDGLDYRIGDQPLIEGISFTLRPGPSTIVLGPNGAGKSLLLRLCHGLIEPSAGTVRWGGLEPASAQSRVAMVFQKPVLLRRSVRANIEYALAVKRIPRGARKARVEEALGDAGLSQIAARAARVLSGGEQQRLAIARAWALQPRVLLLDEPTSNLDPMAIRAIETLIHTIRAAGTRVIMTTHDLAQAKRLGDEVLFLHRGRLLEHTGADEFFVDPKTKPAAAFIEGELLC